MLTWNELYVLDLFTLALFAISYYRNCYRKGYRIDLWHAQLFLMCIFPNLIMLPFAKSDLNFLVLGSDLSAVVAALPRVFLITFVGYMAVLAGGAVWRLKAGLGIRQDAIRVLDIVPRCSIMMMSSPSILVFQSAAVFPGTIGNSFVLFPFERYRI